MGKSKSDIPLTLVWGMLDSRDLDDQIEGWTKLYALVHGGTLAATGQLFAELDKRLEKIDAQVFPYAHRAMKAVYWALHEQIEVRREEEEVKRAVDAQLARPVPKVVVGTLVSGAGAPGVMPAGALGTVLWEVFHQNSRVYHLRDENFQFRDGEAAMIVRGTLGSFSFPEVAFRALPKRGLNLLLQEIAGLKAVGYIARRNLFFAVPADFARWQPKDLLYQFGHYENPLQEPPYWLDPQYYCVREFLAPGIDVAHVATKDGDELTDYALVQYYVVVVDGHPIVVIVCAGCTAAGTFAAAHWAACEIFVEQKGGKRIPAPDGWDRDSRLETLIKVTAQLGADKTGTPPDQVKLDSPNLRVRVKPTAAGMPWKAWDEHESQWRTPTPKYVFFFHPKDEKPNHTNITQIWLDGQRAYLRRDGETLRLLLTICRRKAKGQRFIPLRQLAEDAAIWGEDKMPSEQYVVTRLGQLKDRYLGDAVKIDSDQNLCELTSEVRFEPR